MTPRTRWLIFLWVIAAFAVLIAVASFLIGYVNPFELVVRIFALNGYLMLSVAAIMTSFLREIKRIFDKSFVKAHHTFAAIGIALITAHPVAYAILVLDASVFLPSFGSWLQFWSLAGRPALYIFYLALIAAIVRRRMQTSWRLIHSLMYVVLFFAIVHGNLIGTDFQDLRIRIVYNLSFAASAVTFLIKRYQNYAIRKRAARRSTPN